MSADPITATGTFYPANIDLTIEAIAQSIRDADDTLPEFTDANVIVIDPENSAQEIDAAIKNGVQKAKGIALLVIGGEDAANADPDGASPRPTLTLALQLYLARRRTRRQASASSPLNLCAALAKHLHHRAIRIQGVECFDEITFTGWSTLPDDEYHAWEILFEREIQL